MSLFSKDDASFRHLVFDLDDTLLDTHRQLIPRASREACEAMIRAGLNTNLQNCLTAYAETSANSPRQEVFRQIVEKFGTTQGSTASLIAETGFVSFYNREVETDITLFPGAMELIQRLGDHYQLHLVTSGHLRTQKEKIRILKIEGLFKSIQIVDPTTGDSKGKAFEKIQSISGDLPEQHLSIGNRIDTDIGEARALGWKACWVRYGEYATMIPREQIEVPDFIINDLLELPKACRL